MGNIIFKKVDTVWNLTRHYWFHFLSLISIVAFMMWGFSPVMSVFWATIVSCLTSFLRSDTAMISYDFLRGKGNISETFFQSQLIQALRAGSVGMFSVGATRAGAGSIVGFVTLTRSTERREGKECDSECGSRGSRYHKKQ